MSNMNRRQPARATRTTATRPSNYYARTFSYSSRNGAAREPTPIEAYGFLPAITHFTDGVAALPKEIMRHFTLLKESEGKAYPVDQAVSEAIDRINQLPPAATRQTQSHTQPVLGFSLSNSLNGSAPASVVDGSVPGTQAEKTEVEELSTSDEAVQARRVAFYQLRESVRQILQILDEKNMVLNTANEALARQLARLDNTLPHVEKEISEEARLGSNKHWALPHMKEARRGTMHSHDRSRRDVQSANNLAAAAAAVHEHDIAAVRSEARREAMLNRRRQNVDSDFDDRPASKRPAGNKSRKPGEGQDHRLTNPQAKRRRIDKTTSTPMERIISTGTATKHGAKDAAVERKKPKPATITAPKKKSGPSPPMATSPTRGTFSTRPGEVGGPAHASRPSISRARQNSTQSARSSNDARPNRPPSTTSMGKTASSGPSELKNVAQMTGRSVADVRDAIRETYQTTDGGHAMEIDSINGAIADESTWKREDQPPSLEDAPRSAAAGAGFGEIGVAEAAASADAAPMSRSRSTRGVHNGAAKQSAASSPALGPTRVQRTASKSSVALLAQSIAAGDSIDEDRYSREETEDANDAASSAGSDEPRYCICNQPSYGSMVACDNPNCPHEWFHMECVGLTEEPLQSTKWYCPDCKKTLKRGRNGASNGR